MIEHGKQASNWLYKLSNEFMYDFASTYKAINQKSKQPSNKISDILNSGLSRDANSKEKTNF